VYLIIEIVVNKSPTKKIYNEVSNFRRNFRFSRC